MKVPFLLVAVAVAFGCSTPQEDRIAREAHLQKKYASYSTAELKLRRNQIVAMLGATKKDIDIKIGPPLAMALMDDSGKVQDLLEEKNAIERELLRRWNGGDTDAKLDIFSREL